MNIRSPLLEVSCGVHNHQTEMWGKWEIIHNYCVVYSVKMEVPVALTSRTPPRKQKQKNKKTKKTKTNKKNPNKKQTKQNKTKQNKNR